MFSKQQVDPFSLEIYGNGDHPRTLALGGLAFAPSDYAGVAEKLPGTTYVVNNPIHTGAVKRTTDWQEYLRSQYAKIFSEFDMDFVIGHSCGSYDAVHVASQSPHVKGLIMLTPPAHLNLPNSVTRLEEYGILDMCLALLSSDLTDEMYARMIASHQIEYGHKIKDIYRHELPDKTGQGMRAIQEKMRALKIPSLIILGKDDPWNKLMTPDRPEDFSHVSVVELEGNHYLHFGNPDRLASVATPWIMQNFIDHSAEAVESEFELAIT